MPSTILFSNASFDQPAQTSILRSIESVKRKVQEDDTLKLYENYLGVDTDSNKEKKESSNNSKGILKSVDEYVEFKKINTVSESQSPNTEVGSDLGSVVKKRKLKMIPNKIEVAKKDAKNKTINFMTKVSVFFLSIFVIIPYNC